MTKDHIGYNKIVNKSMFLVIEEALLFVKKNSGFPGDHHFYITFDTKFDGVDLSLNLLQKFPEEMTIVLQHQFSELDVKSNMFAVTLHFGNNPERIIVPYKAIRKFFDPSVNFGLDLNTENNEQTIPTKNNTIEVNHENQDLHQPNIISENVKNSGQVISLNQFKKDLKK
tara:strand:- start:21 stop:530 length:510 start_codon:yes stop_codon:yes gene_type:complete